MSILVVICAVAVDPFDYLQGDVAADDGNVAGDQQVALEGGEVGLVGPHHYRGDEQSHEVGEHGAELECHLARENMTIALDAERLSPI